MVCGAEVIVLVVDDEVVVEGDVDDVVFEEVVDVSVGVVDFAVVSMVVDVIVVDGFVVVGWSVVVSVFGDVILVVVTGLVEVLEAT